MEYDKLSFLDDKQSVASVITNLHELFKNNYSHYKIERSRLLSQLDATSDAQEEERIHGELREIDGEITIYGILQDALSIADRVIQARVVMAELGNQSDVYRIHHENEGE